jgi:acetyl-CoA carboxylase biotin carboxyl carrier protein
VTGTNSLDDDPARMLALMCAEARRLAAGDGLVSRVLLHVGDISLELERCLELAAASPAAAIAASADPGKGSATGVEYVTAPVVGTFYHSPEPGRTPFVKVGDTVDEDTVVGIIEAMKLMNKITANRRGVVTAALVPDATSVEYGQRLLEISPGERPA